MHILRSTVFSVSLSVLTLPTVVSAEVHQLNEREYQQFIDDLIGAIEKGSVGVGGRGGSGGPAGGGQPSNPPSGGNNDGDAGNDDQGDGIGESW